METKKKILIISYYWPPAGGPGVQRWLKFVKYLPENGWQPTVFIPENPSYPLLDESLLQEIPPGIEILKNKIWEPYQIAEKLSGSNKKFKAGQFDVGKNQSWKSKLSIWIRGNFFIPDARVFWVKPSIKVLEKYLTNNHFDAVVTTGPPHSVHLIGMGLKKKFPKLKWLADFRDPWTEISYYKHLKLTKKSDKKHRELESSVFRNADICLATSYTDAEKFKQKGAKAVCITNGFDKDDKTTIPLAKTNQFTLSYVGVLEQLRNPEVLWNVLSELVLQNDEFAENFELKFVGRIDDKILGKLEKTNLKLLINNIGYINHDASFQEMQESDLLLISNFPNEKSKGIIPGKLFEYLSTGKNILSFGPKNSDVAVILGKTKAGKHFEYVADKNDLENFILDKFQEWKKGIQNKNNTNIEEFSRKNLTTQLVNLLEKK